MMLHPEGRAVFVEIPRTGSTAATVFLRSHGWFQNGARGHHPLPMTMLGRHAPISPEARVLLRAQDVPTFAVVRNPWDRMASAWRIDNGKEGDLERYLKHGRFMHGKLDILRMTQVSWTYGVEHVLRYETLEHDWDTHIWHLPALPRDGFARLNVPPQPKPDWTQEAIDIVAKRFAPDIERWGWTGPTIVT